MASNLTMRFYRVERKHAGQPEFATCLQRLASITNDDDRQREIAEVPIGSTSLVATGKIFSGDLFRVQTENLPTLLRKGQPPTALSLPVGGGLGHHTAFIFEPATGMLGYQLARSSVSMERFNLYASGIGETDPFVFLPVIKPDELRALSQISAKKFIVKVAEPHDLEAIEADHKSLRDAIIHLQECMDGAYIRVQIGMGQKKGNLGKEVIQSTIGWLLEQRAKKRGKVQSMKVEGKNLDGTDADPLNFLRAHVGMDESVLMAGLTPQENYAARLAFLLRAELKSRSILKAFVKKT